MNTAIEQGPDPRSHAVGPAQWMIGSIAVLLLSYTALRASMVSFTWDEAFTFMNHVHKGVFYQQVFDDSGANHHMLNVWSMWASMKLFGTSELALRIPNLLAHVLYLYASARLALRATQPVLAVVAFMLLNVHPYLLDFFSLARGYGLANGFMMLALWQLWRFADEGRKAKAAILGTLFASIAVVAHTIMLNFLLGIVAAFIGTWLVEAHAKGTKPDLKPMFVLLGVIVACFAVVLPTAIGMYKGGSLYFGSDGLWQGMISSLAEKFFYHFGEPLVPLTMMTWVLGTIAVWSGIALSASRHRGWKSLPLLLGWGGAGVILLSLFAQHILLDLPWPRARTALFLVPLLAYLVVAALHTWRGAVWLPISVGLVFVVPAIMHMNRCWNLDYVIEWRPSGHFRRILQLIEKDHLPLTPQRPIVTVGIGGECPGSIAYYTHILRLQWLVTSDRQSQDSFPICDYYVAEWDAEHLIDHANWTLLYRSEATGTALYRDRRLRKEVREVSHLGHQNMEGGLLTGTTTEDHVSGERCIRFDRKTRGIDTLIWTVPSPAGDAPMILLGSAQVKQQDDTNRLALVIRHVRGGQVIDERVDGSVPQTRAYHEWNKIVVALSPRSVMPGDRFMFMALPYGSAPPLLMDDMEFWLVR